MPEKAKLTGLSELGEFGFIDHISTQFSLKNESSLLGIGDDAAIIDHKGNKTLISSDIFMEGIHFDLVYFPLKHLGYKATVSNISDILAMNAHPRQLLVNIGISSKMSLEAIDELYSGIRFACEKYGLDLIGGDTSPSVTGLCISMTIIGEASADEIVYRSTAEPGDLICLTGDVGASYMGLQILEREKKVFDSNPGVQPELISYDYVLKRQLMPEGRMDILQLLRELNVKPSSMIDVSDGVASDVLQICKASKKGCRIYEEKIPYHKETKRICEEMNIEAAIAGLNGGEDFELLFTIRQKDYKKIERNKDISVIGHILESDEKKTIMLGSGSEVPLIAQGWKYDESISS